MRADRNSPLPGNGRQKPAQRSNGDASPAAAPDDLEQRETTEPDALKQLLKQFHELGEYFSYYVAAKTDYVKLSLRTAVLWLAFAALSFVVVAALIISASWLVLAGIAEGLGILFGERLWAGNLTAGLLLLAVLGLAMYFAVSKWRETSRERAVQKYDERQTRQQADFGHDVDDQAAAATSEKK